jgi:type I restriction enzyme M protein
MADDKKQQLETKLWSIADTLRGKMDADDFRDYILGFIFYKYLSEKMHAYANTILKPDKIKCEDGNDDEEFEEDLKRLLRTSRLCYT